MIILLVFAFLSGLVTILAPCIWPLLPIILSSSTTGTHHKSLGVTLGIMTSFAFFTLTISYLVMLFHFDPNILRLFAVMVIGLLGITMIVPVFTEKLEGFVSRLSGMFGGIGANRSGFTGGYITGFSLGLIWSPCAGPILATIATLGATQTVSFQLVLVTLFYVLGVGIPLFIFSYGGNILFTKSRFVSQYTGRIQQVFGVVMILTAIAIYTNYDKVIQVKLLDAFPSYSTFLNQLESNEKVREQLDILKGKKSSTPKLEDMMPLSPLSVLGRAPEFVGITNWLNSDPLTMQQLKGKVVLVDFWTYTCINCIRTLPYVTSWYEKYKDQEFVVVGVHTPEFEFEKKTENVEVAIKQYNIRYPVAQDNNYATWNAYNNQYWPAKYLVDADGNIRYAHFGEGKYQETEMAIKKLLEEKGATLDKSFVPITDQTPKDRFTPETYLGKKRGNGLVTFGGSWDIQDEQAVASKGSTLELSFYANKVFLVVTPVGKNDRAKIFLDDKLVGELVFDVAKLYELVDLKGNKGDHILRIEFQTPGTAVYAFTFG